MKLTRREALCAVTLAPLVPRLLPDPERVTAGDVRAAHRELDRNSRELLTRELERTQEELMDALFKAAEELDAKPVPQDRVYLAWDQDGMLRAFNDAVFDSFEHV